MVSRSTLHRRRKGLVSVGVDLDALTWSELKAFTGAITKRGAVEAALRSMVAAHTRQDALNNLYATANAAPEPFQD